MNKIREIKLTFIGGTHLDDAKLQAKEMSLKYMCDVEFRFNGKTHLMAFEGVI